MTIPDRPSVAAATVAIDTATSGDNTIVAASANRRIVVDNYVLVCDGAVAVKWKSGSDDASGAMSFAANGGVTTNSNRGQVLETGKNEALILNLSAAVQVSGHLTFHLVS